MLGVYLLLVFSRGLWEIKQAYLRMAEARGQLATEEAKRQDLKKKEAMVTNVDYIERVARDNLNMQKEGELVVVIPKTPIDAKALVGRQETDANSEPNWRKWWKLVR